MISKRILIGSTLVGMLLIVTAGFGDVPHAVNYQGRLTDSVGEPVTATVPITFHVYDSETGGVCIWTEDHLSVGVEDGLFTVVLGSFVPIPDSVFDAPDRWLEIVVADETIDPRTELTASPYTLSAHSVNGDIVTEPGKVSIGITDPEYELHVDGTGKFVSSHYYSGGDVLSAEYTGSDTDIVAVRGKSCQVDGTGVAAYFEGGRMCVWGRVVPSGDGEYRGVYGSARGGSGTNWGVLGLATGAGLNYGIWGSATEGSTNWAGYFYNGDVKVTNNLTKGGGHSRLTTLLIRKTSGSSTASSNRLI